MLFKNIKKAVFAVVLVSLLVLTACGGSTENPASKDGALSSDSSLASGDGSAATDSPAVIALTIQNGGSHTIDKAIAGTVVIDTEEKLTLTLKGASISASTGPAVYVKNCGGLEIILEGENTLCDNEVYSAEHNELKGALFSEDDIAFSGDGSLSVTGKRSHAIACDDGITVKGGTITVESAVKDGVHANNLIEVKGGSLTVKSAGGDAMECEALITVSGGNLDLSSTGDGIKASL